MEPNQLAAALVEHCRQLGPCVVAFSGGVDSGVVAAAAYRALGNQAIAITGIGPAVSQADLDAAHRTASSIGMTHTTLPTDEILDANYQKNDHRRCFYCKTNLYSKLRQWADENGYAAVLSGTNADDQNDYRPGLEAAALHNIQAPLAALQIGKQAVRALAKHWSLPVADRPASPCLASRIAYGETVTVSKLKQLEQAERWLHERGFIDVRVRWHAGDLARIEVDRNDFERLCLCPLRDAMTAYFQQLGFKFVTLDLGGRQSGSLNRLLPIYGS